MEEVNIAMTRSLGDFLCHSYGISEAAEVRSVDVGALTQERGWSCCSLLVASDGVWDMWGYEEVAERLVPPASDSTALAASLVELLKLGDAFAEATRAKSAIYFEESADNLTGVLKSLV